MATNLDHVKNKTSLDREKYECIMKEYWEKKLKRIESVYFMHTMEFKIIDFTYDMSVGGLC